jgi:hypothetical protein
VCVVLVYPDGPGYASWSGGASSENNLRPEQDGLTAKQMTRARLMFYYYLSLVNSSINNCVSFFPAGECQRVETAEPVSFGSRVN